MIQKHKRQCLMLVIFICLLLMDISYYLASQRIFLQSNFVVSMCKYCTAISFSSSQLLFCTWNSCIWHNEINLFKLQMWWWINHLCLLIISLKWERCMRQWIWADAALHKRSRRYVQCLALLSYNPGWCNETQLLIKLCFSIFSVNLLWCLLTDIKREYLTVTYMGNLVRKF